MSQCPQYLLDQRQIVLEYARVSKLLGREDRRSKESKGSIMRIPWPLTCLERVPKTTFSRNSHNGNYGGGERGVLNLIDRTLKGEPATGCQGILWTARPVAEPPRLIDLLVKADQ
jgi:hypothetical protein